MTSNFEVRVNGKLLHSKIGGDGFFHTNAKSQVVVIDEIQRIVEEAEAETETETDS